MSAKMRVPFRWTATGLFVLAAVGSCRQVAGIDDRERDDDECKPSGSSLFATESCAACVRASCCSALSGCENDAACAARFSCRAACSDDACRAACDEATQFTQASAALLACESSSCAEACGVSCGASQLVAFGCDPKSSCRDTCCAAALERDRNLEAGLLRVCSGACPAGDELCPERCANDFPVGASLARAVEECLRTSCGPKPPWQCVGQVNWAGAKQSELEVGLTLQDYLTGKRLPGLTVSGCSAAGASCEPPPFGSQVTNDDGTATLKVKTPFSSPYYPGYLEVTGTSLGSTYHFLHYFTPPVIANSSMAFNAPSMETAGTLATLVGVKLDPARGHVLLQLSGCGASATRVSIAADKADAMSTTFYLKDGIPSVELTENASETAGVVNLPPGLVEISAYANEICKTVGRVQMLVRPGALTFTRLPPTP